MRFSLKTLILFLFTLCRGMCGSLCLVFLYVTEFLLEVFGCMIDFFCVCVCVYLLIYIYSRRNCFDITEMIQ